MKFSDKSNKSSKLIFVFIICVFLIFTYLLFPGTINSVYGSEIPDGGTVVLPPNPNMRIGLIFGSGAVESFQTSSETGFLFGYAQPNASDKFNIIFYIRNEKIAVSKSANLAKNAAGRYFASTGNIQIGKYSIEFDMQFTDFVEAYNFIGNLPKDIFGHNIFSAYIDGNIVVRFGNFTSADAARAHMSGVSGSSPAALKVAGESNQTTVVIDPDTDRVLFQYEDGENNFAAAAALPSTADLVLGQSISELSSKNTGFMTTPANNIYSGAFVYVNNGTVITVINLISLEEYIKGVVPYEISPSWPEEALKAFSITVRSYSLKSMRRHESAGFMLCNDTHCQYYAGSRRANDDTNAAVDATKDFVMTYDGEIVEALYHSSSGGVTENHNDAWGGELRLPYLTSVTVPYENYADPDRNNSLWKNTVSPRELYDYLVGASPQSSRFRGKLNSEIANIIINERSPVSNYIKSVSVVDRSGNRVTIQTSAVVRSAFSKYANSGNMDIYRPAKFKSFMLSGADAVNQDIEAGKTYISTANGSTTGTPADGVLHVLTGNGKYTVRAYSSGSDFIFDGRGWGHGVGLSQWGMHDMAAAGYKYDEILKTYYTGVSIEKIENIANAGR